MRVLFVGKREPQQRDLVERPYGRFYHLPIELSRNGHDVRVQLCSHRRRTSLALQREGVQWSSHDVRNLGVRNFWSTLTREATAFQPDWILGCSDAWYGWLANKLARLTGARLAIDAYDNYEAYMRWNLPLHWKWRSAVRAADLVTAAGPQLAAHLQAQRRGGRPVAVVPMAADPEFRIRDRRECRRLLNLPDHAPLLGYVGSWTKTRGTHLILDAFERVRAVRPDARLVLSGRPPASVLGRPGVIGLGYLPDAQLPVLVSALDVACIVTADTAFGRYSYPAKLCEAMACEVPVVASATGAIRWMLDGRAGHLARLDDPGDFADRALEMLERPVANYGKRTEWADSGRTLESLLMGAALVTPQAREAAARSA